MRNNKITALPSKVIMPSGNIVILDELKKAERSRVQSYICKNIANQISNYYSSRQEEWKNFVEIMT